MSRGPIKHYVGWTCIFLLAGIFGYSGAIKLANPDAFALAVYRYHLLPNSLINIAALWIAAMELACAFFLLFIPRLRQPALWVIIGLLIVFSFGTGMNILRGNQMSCGCFSTSPMAHSVGWFGMLKNCGLISLALYGICSSKPARNASLHSDTGSPD